jgi:hypothetical protein
MARGAVIGVQSAVLDGGYPVDEERLAKPSMSSTNSFWMR